MEIVRILEYLSDKAMLTNPKWWSVICALILLLDKNIKVMCNNMDGRSFQDHPPYSTEPIVNITYKDPITGETKREFRDKDNSYGNSSPHIPINGTVIHVRTHDNKTHGCTPPINVPPNTKWIALIERGECKFNKKIENASVIHNASAVVVYNHDSGEGDSSTVIMDHKAQDKVVAIFIPREFGKRIATLVDNGTTVTMHIYPSRASHMEPPAFNRTSILFVSISFIVLMIISLAWLVFYYIQRFRYAHAKERLSKRLMNAAKKALSKMPLRTIKAGDKEVDSEFEQCAVCIEGYVVSDVLRILPCRHMFHKSCVDPWLIEQRSCPMCKLDILKAYGLQIHPSRESIANIDVEGPSTSLGVSDLLLGEAHRDLEVQSVEIIRYQPDILPPLPGASHTATPESTSQVKNARPESTHGSTTVIVETPNIDDRTSPAEDANTDANSCHDDAESSEKQSLLPKRRKSKKSYDELDGEKQSLLSKETPSEISKQDITISGKDKDRKDTISDEDRDRNIANSSEDEKDAGKGDSQVVDNSNREVDANSAADLETLMDKSTSGKDQEST